MKNKCLYTELTTAVEQIAAALRRYDGGSTHCSITVSTRDAVEDAEETPDFYGILVNKIHGDGTRSEVIESETGYLYRDSEGGIIKVERIGGVKDDTQG